MPSAIAWILDSSNLKRSSITSVICPLAFSKSNAFAFKIASVSSNKARAIASNASFLDFVEAILISFLKRFTVSNNCCVVNMHPSLKFLF